MRYSALLSLSLAGCGSVPPALPQAGSWANQCYVNLDRDVSKIAGPSAIDCGFLPLDASRNNRIATEACAKNAAGNGKPFKFGYGSFGDDSAYCDVAIRGPDGQIISLFYDSDVTGQMGAKGNHSAVWTSRCKAIKFRPGTLGLGSFFEMQECSVAPEIFSGLSDHN